MGFIFCVIFETSGHYAVYTLYIKNAFKGIKGILCVVSNKIYLGIM